MKAQTALAEARELEVKLLRKRKAWLQIVIILVATYLTVAIVVIAWWNLRLVYLPSGLAIFDHPTRYSLVKVPSGGLVGCGGEDLYNVLEIGFVSGDAYIIVRDVNYGFHGTFLDSSGAAKESYCVLDAGGTPQLRGSRTDAMSFISSRVTGPKITWYPVHLVRPVTY